MIFISGDSVKGESEKDLVWLLLGYCYDEIIVRLGRDDA